MHNQRVLVTDGQLRHALSVVRSLASDFDAMLFPRIHFQSRRSISIAGNQTHINYGPKYANDRAEFRQIVESLPVPYTAKIFGWL